MDNLIGKTLDGLYTVRELIGTGGMANVYKAVVGLGGPVPEGTVVAVKVLRQELMHDPDLVRRFKSESKAISLLNHPNIVKVYDVSVSEKLQYIVMEYVDGMTLREYLNERGGRLTSRETVHFISQILKALDHAHRNGVVHRDIKPQNIMLLDNGQLRMMDFGIARISRAENQLSGGKAMGSVHYISPEQAKGETYDKVLGLELGADDYIVKPFDAKEVTARIKAVLRRSSAKEEENKGVYDFDNLHLDMNRYELKVKGKVVEAPPKELELLACLAGHPNRVYTRDQLLDEVWGFEYYGDSRTIDVHVKRLREKLEGASEQWSLKTVWGVGYKFEVRE